MTTMEVINHLYKAGLSVELPQGERINLKPTNLVTPILVNLVKFHKQALIKYFKEKDTPKTTKPKFVGFHQIYDSDPLLKALQELGEQICDYWNDSDAARAEMKDDILSYPPYQREALMATLEGSLRSEKPRFKTRQEEASFTHRINLFFGRSDAKELAHQFMNRDR